MFKIQVFRLTRGCVEYVIFVKSGDLSLCRRFKNDRSLDVTFRDNEKLSLTPSRHRSHQCVRGGDKGAILNKLSIPC